MTGHDIERQTKTLWLDQLRNDLKILSLALLLKIFPQLAETGEAPSAAMSWRALIGEYMVQII